MEIYLYILSLSCFGMVDFVKINEKLPIVFLIIWYCSIFFVTSAVSDTIRTISYTLLTLLGVFFGFLIVKDILQRYQASYNQRRTRIQRMINSSIEKETSSRTQIKEKIRELQKRIGLYEKLDKMSPKEITFSAFFSLVFLILTLLVNAFLVPINDIPNLPMKSYHISYTFFLIGLFFILRLLAIFLSLVEEA